MSDDGAYFRIGYSASCFAGIRRVYTGPDGQVLFQWRDYSDDQERILAINVNVDADGRRNRGPLARRTLYWMIAALAMVLAVIYRGR
jgi:hypothetical protein